MLLVTDIPADPALPLWLSFDAKTKRAHALTPPRMRDFVREALRQGAVKYDATLDLSQSIDLGDVSIVEQILAVEADLLVTHYADADAQGSVRNWTGVGFNDCGYVPQTASEFANNTPAF